MKCRIINALLAAVLLLSACGTSRHTPGTEAKLYGYKPLGFLETVAYPCSVPGPSERKLTVYLPPDYYLDSTARFPVVYLLHGARGSETTWIWRGHLPQMVDSLYLDDKASQAIFVLPDVNSFKDDADYDGSRFKSSLGCMFGVDGVVETGFVHDVVGFVDAHFRTVPDKAHRAIAGMSIGGMQAAYLSANSPDTFGYVGLFSPISGTVLRYSPKYNRFYQDFRKKLAAQFLDPPAYYLMTSGSDDILTGWQTRHYHKIFERKGYAHDYLPHIAVGHEWSCWISSLNIFLGKCFD